METSEMLTSLGYVLKREKLASLASNYTYNELILEDLDPYPGFYDHFFVPANEGEKRPRSIFLIIKEMDVCKEDSFIRMTMHVKREHKVDFDAAMAIIQLFNKPTPSIRVFMDDYDQLPELLAHYKKAGMNFQGRKELKPFQSLIEVRKFFELKCMEQDIYMDLDQSDTYYLRMPAYLGWDDFEQATISIRNNMNHKLYDAAQAAIYEKSGLVDLVRIYDRKADIDSLRLLKQKYLAEFSRTF